VLTLEGITLDSPGITDTSAERDKQGAAAVVAAEVPLRGDARMTATGLRRPERCDWTAGHGSCVVEPLTTRPPGLLLSSISPSPPGSWTHKRSQIGSRKQKGSYRRWERHPSQVLGIPRCLQHVNSRHAGTAPPNWPFDWPSAVVQDTIHTDLQPLSSWTRNSQGIHRDEPIKWLQPSVIIISSGTDIVSEEKRRRSINMCGLLGAQFGNSQKLVSCNIYLGDAQVNVWRLDFHNARPLEC